jgi:hypothetical protein
MHAPHFASVAAASLAAWHVGAAPPGRRRGPWVALALTAPLLVPSHASGKLLAPAIAALVVAGRGRVALAPAAGAAALVLAGELVSLALCAAFGWTQGDETSAVLYFRDSGQDPATVLLRGWLVPLGVLGPAALGYAAAAARRRPLVALAVALAIVPEAAFFTWWGWAEHGGYALAALPAATAATALLLRGRAALAAAVLAVALHVGLAWTQGLVRRDTWREADRAEALERALPDGGTVYALQMRAPTADLLAPGVHERSLAPILHAAREAGVPPADFGARFFASLGPGSYAFDRSSLTDPWFEPEDCGVYLESLGRAFAARPDARRVRVGDWVVTATDEPPR